MVWSVLLTGSVTSEETDRIKCQTYGNTQHTLHTMPCGTNMHLKSDTRKQYVHVIIILPQDFASVSITQVHPVSN